MNTDTWNDIKAAGDRWEALNTQLVEAQFRVMELERETTTAYVEFQQALASVQTSAPIVPVQQPMEQRQERQERQEPQREPCEWCGKPIVKRRAGKHYNSCPKRPAQAVHPTAPAEPAAAPPSPEEPCVNP